MGMDAISVLGLVCSLLERERFIIQQSCLFSCEVRNKYIVFENKNKYALSSFPCLLHESSTGDDTFAQDTWL